MNREEIIKAREERIAAMLRRMKILEEQLERIKSVNTNKPFTADVTNGTEQAIVKYMPNGETVYKSQFKGQRKLL